MPASAAPEPPAMRTAAPKPGTLATRTAASAAMLGAESVTLALITGARFASVAMNMRVAMLSP